MINLSRRKLLLGASSLALIGISARLIQGEDMAYGGDPAPGGRPASGGGPASAGAPPLGPLPKLTVEIAFPGHLPTADTLVYDIAKGTDLGSYTAPTAGFTQRCIRVRHPSLPHFMVDFRPDLSGGRVEIVFWNGEALGTVASHTYRNLPAYNAVVKLNGVAQSDWRGVSSWAIPYHYWGNRWRWQSAQRPYIRTASRVFSEGFLPKMSKAAARIAGYNGVIVPQPPPIPNPSNNNGKNGDGSAMTNGTNGYLYLPFMTADQASARLWGILCNGDTGGYRDEQGLVTRWQGDWLVNGTPSSLNTFMQQAEFFSCQANAVFLPDQAAGGPINTKADLAHYKATTFCNYGNYYNIVTGMVSGTSSGGFRGTISGDVLTVTTEPASRGISPGMILKSYTNSGTTYDSIPAGTYVMSQLTGTPRGAGSYKLSRKVENAPALMVCFATTGEFVSKGDEHSPQTYYLPWVITEDPFYIEGAQYQENASLQAGIYYKEVTIGRLTNDPTGKSGINGPFTCPCGNSGITEERGLGWSVKNIASCYAMTPKTGAPSWLLPRSYWAAISSDVSSWIDWQRAQWPADQYYKVFHSFALQAGDTPQTFYKAYAIYSLGFADLVKLPVPAAAGRRAPSSWFDQLTYIFDWVRQTTDAGLGSGWNVQNPLLHDLEPNSFMTNQVGPTAGCAPGTPTVRPAGKNCVTNWADMEKYAGAYTRDTSPYPSNPSPGFIGPQSQLGNAGPLVASVAVAKSRGVEGAASCFTFLNSLIDYSYPQAKYFRSFNVQDGFDGT